MFVNNISSIQDVKDFFLYLYYVRDVNFHPDDGFDIYINFETKQPTFSDNEIETFNNLMQECFKIYKDHDMDIYDFTSTITPKFDC